MELLVVIAIIGILIALLLPAVQAAREAARRVQCANNMKQTALAVHSFHDAYNMLPSSRTCEHHATWLAQILPYLEEVGLSERWDIERCFYDQPEPVRTTVVPAFLCPARGGENVIIENIPDNVHPRHGKTPYKGSVSDYACTTGSEHVGAGHNGQYLNGALIYGDHEGFPRYPEIMKGWKSRTSFNDIRDGLSQTFLAGEASYRVARKGACAFNGDHNGGILLGPSYPLVHTRDDYGFGSDHPGICQFVLCDGSVQSVAVGTSATLLGAMVTRAGGEIIEGDLF